MPKKTTPYIYGPQDDPLKVADQFGITPNALLAANPGGFPFQTGQNILIPTNYQYSAPIGPQPMIGPAPATGGGGRGSILPQNPIGTIQNPNLAMRGRGYQAPGTYAQSEQGAPFLSSEYGTDDSWYRPDQGATTAAPAGIQPTPAGNTDYSQTQAAQRYAAAGTSFVNQMRWDPQAKKFVSIGRLLKQGKLDLKGNWRKTTKRQRQAKRQEQVRNQQQAQVEQKQDYTLANSLISFSVSSG